MKNISVKQNQGEGNTNSEGGDYVSLLSSLRRKAQGKVSNARKASCLT